MCLYTSSHFPHVKTVLLSASELTLYPGVFYTKYATEDGRDMPFIVTKNRKWEHFLSHRQPLAENVH